MSWLSAGRPLREHQESLRAWSAVPRRGTRPRASLVTDRQAAGGPRQELMPSPGEDDVHAALNAFAGPPGEDRAEPEPVPPVRLTGTTLLSNPRAILDWTGGP